MASSLTWCVSILAFTLSQAAGCTLRHCGAILLCVLNRLLAQPATCPGQHSTSDLPLQVLFATYIEYIKVANEATNLADLGVLAMGTDCAEDCPACSLEPEREPPCEGELISRARGPPLVPHFGHLFAR